MMDRKLDYIIAKVDKIDETQVKQEVNLGRLTVSVEDHIRRTALLEDALKPVQRHVTMVEGALKALGVVGILAGIMEAIALWFRH